MSHREQFNYNFLEVADLEKFSISPRVDLSDHRGRDLLRHTEEQRLDPAWQLLTLPREYLNVPRHHGGTIYQRGSTFFPPRRSSASLFDRVSGLLKMILGHFSTHGGVTGVKFGAG